jgi:multiple sugar transport system substrate-binding protein
MRSTKILYGGKIMIKKHGYVSALTVIVAMLMVLTSFAGCAKTSGSSNSSGAKEITVLLPQNEMDTVGFMKQQTTNFEKAKGVKVQLINMSWDNVAAKVTTAMAAGSSSYDVTEFDNSWVSKFTKNKWIVPLDNYMTQDMKSGIISGLLQIFSANGKTYGIPWNNDTRFFMYNKSKLDAAGISAPPKTWDELVQDTKILQSKGLVKYGLIDGYAQAQALTNEVTSVVYSYGGDFLANGKPTVTSDVAVKNAYDFLQKAVTDKIIDPASMTSDQENAGNVFCQGDTAFFPQAWAGLYEQSNTASSSKVVGQIAIASYSLSENGSSNVVLSLPEAMAIPTTSKHKDLAWEYIQYMSSRTFDKDKAITIGALPIYSTTFSDKDVIKKYPYWVNFGLQSKNAKGLETILWYDQFSNAVQVESQKMLLNQESVSDGLKSLQGQLTSLSQSSLN